MPSGNAEKAFYNVCKTNDEEIDDECMEVMNDIIGTLEADHIQNMNMNDPVNDQTTEIRYSIPKILSKVKLAKIKLCSNFQSTFFRNSNFVTSVQNVKF